jgi:outer membrane lipoprotein-sorting protein
MIPKSLLVSFLVSAIFSWQSLAQNIDELISGHLEACGGLTKLKALKSVKMSGKLLMPMMMQNVSTEGSAAEAPVTVQIKKPNLVRMEIDLQGKPLVQAFDGETAWSLRPGSKEPDNLSEDEGGMGEMADLFLREIADLEGPLVDSKDKWNKVELLGKEDVDGTESYKLKLSPKDGFVRYLFLDTKTLRTTKVTRPGSEFLMETYYKDHKPVNGLMVPYVIESKVDGNTFSKLMLEKAEPDVSLDDALFKMPGNPPQN